MSRSSAKFIDKPFAYHQEVELTIDSILSDGRGLGRVTIAEGGLWVVMVPFVAQNERVRVKIYRNHKDYSEGDLVEVLESSEDRVAPKCPIFGVCGGCQYQHLSYAAQLKLKTEQVKELLDRAIKGNTFTVRPAIGSPEEYNYRSKLTPHYEKHPVHGEPIGFLKNGHRRALVDVPQCPIATPAINKALPALREKTHQKAPGIKKDGTLLLRDTDLGVLTENGAMALETVGQWKFQFQAGEFFQNNPFILQKLINYVINEAKGSGEGMRYLIDAYCGVGVFAIASSIEFERFTGIEVNANAIHWARANALMNKANNGEFLIGEAQRIFDAVKFPSNTTACVIDPPRSGCSSDFLTQLLHYRPARLVYVSCDPSTQARDCQILMDGDYKVEAVQPFDLFPQTKHIENVITFFAK
jgi:tRNA/tmRNA/rRNA uracil-C5-methylase (TrmA/RlmC/RlmD family)